MNVEVLDDLPRHRLHPLKAPRVDVALDLVAGGALAK